jgi:hypothetical protein
MALRETPHQAEADLFRQELVNLINLNHPLAQLAGKIDWDVCETRFRNLRPLHSLLNLNEFSNVLEFFS